MIRFIRCIGILFPRLSIIFFLLYPPFACADSLKNIAGVNVDQNLDEAGYRDIYALGFRYVRLSFPRKPLVSTSPPYEMDPVSVSILEKNITFARAAGIRILVDPHYFPGMSGRYSMKPTDQIWGDPVFEDALVRFWSSFSKRFSETDDVFFAYDLLNEPSPPQYVKGRDRCSYLEALYGRIIAAIRENDPSRLLVVQFPMALGPTGKSTNQMDGARCFANAKWDNVAYSFHMYDPGQFTHQGVAGFPYPISLYKKDGRDSVVKYLRKRLDVVRAWQDRNGSPVFVGEFGASIYSGAEGDQYIRDLLMLFDEYGWGWFFHSFREADVWNPEMPSFGNELSDDSPKSLRIDALSLSAKRRIRK